MPDITISGTDSPYTSKTYTAGATEKNTLSITSYFKLLSAQLANQDMTNPMSTSDMMNQMSQMAMVQSLTAMTDSIKTSGTLSKQSYAAGMIGKQVEYTGKSYNTDGTAVADGNRKGIIESVNFSGTSATFRVAGDPNDYELDAILAVMQNKAETKPESAGTQPEEKP